MPNKEKSTEKGGRVSVDLSKSAIERLEKMMAATEAESKVEVIREALRLYEFFIKKALQGYSIQCVSVHGEVTEVFASSLPSAEVLSNTGAPNPRGTR